MKIPKITKALPLVLALAMATSCVFAADEVPGTEGTQSTDMTADYQLTLDTFFDIDVKAPAEAVGTKFDEDYTTIEMANSLVGMYEVVSNTNTKTFYLYGKCPTSDGDQPALYGTLGNLKIVLTNTTTGSIPDSEAVSHITGGGQTSFESPNAIAFSFTESYKHEETPTNDWLEDGYTFDDEKAEVTYGIANGKHTLTYTVSGFAKDNSFSTMDTKGTYKATLTLTDTQL